VGQETAAWRKRELDVQMVALQGGENREVNLLEE
jgi:hypothetical protein